MRIIFGLILVIIGFFIAWKSNSIVETFGRIDWAEKHLSLDGGTRLFWKLFGILAIIVGFMITFNLLGGILISIFGSTFSSFGPATPQ